MHSMFEKIRYELRQARGLLGFGFLQALGQGCTMAAPLVVAKFFSREAFGSYSLAKMIAFFFSTLLVASLQTPFIVHANQERARTGKINKAFTVQCVFLAVSSAVVIVLATVFRRQLAAFAVIGRGDLVFVVLAFAGLATKNFFCNIFMALGRRMRNAQAELLFGLVTLGLVLVLHLTDAVTLRNVFAIYPVAAICVVAVFVWRIDFGQLLPLSFDASYCRQMFDFAKWIILGSTAVYFINWGDNLVLRAYVSMGRIGSYNLAYQVFKGLLTLIFVLYGYFLPFVSEHIGDREKVRSYLYVKRPRIMAGGIIVIAALFAGAGVATEAVYGHAYPETPGVFRILLVGAVMMLHVILYAPVLNALKRYRFAQSGNAIQVLLNLVLDLVLVPRMGIHGAAIATSFAYFVHAVIIEIYFRLELKKFLKV